MATRKSWHLDRRTFLRGAGVALALPWMESMESMAAGATAADRETAPKRFCAVYFPYGVSLREAGTPAAEWNWFPAETGKDFQFGKSHAALEPLRDEVTILSGLSHPACRQMGGHDTADTWLTAAEMKEGHLKNSVSLDQVMAMRSGDATRYASLILSTDGGVGEPTRASTLSFDRNGTPLPSSHQPRLIFDRLFGVDPSSAEAQRQRLSNSGSMLDLIAEHSRSLRGKLGKIDQAKLDEYLTSVRQIEQRVERSEQWLEVPKPQVDSSGLSLEADDSTPGELIRTMYDLIYLAFQTDQTRIATYQLGNMNGATSIAGKFPQLLGLSASMHTLAHDARKSDAGAEPLGLWDRMLTEQLAYFLERLRSTPEGDGTMLDSTIVFYGTSNSQTHVNENYALLTAGGRGLGMRHGAHLSFPDSVPLSNLFTTFLNKTGPEAESFADSTSELTEITA